MNQIKEGYRKIKNHTDELQRAVKERTVGYITAAFGLVAGLAWNEAIKALIELLFPGKANSVTAKFIYAAAITLIVVVLTVYLVRLVKREEK